MSNVIEVPPVTLRVDDHGVMRVGQTRVRLDTIVTAWKQGDSPEQIAENFDALDLADVYGVISYYLNHRLEVEAYLEQNQEAGESLRAENERRFPPAGIRERLLSRRVKMVNEES
jgi:uncharacterized protein (DUF433 family)